MRELPTRVAWHISKLVGFKLDLVYELGACKEQSVTHIWDVWADMAMYFNGHQHERRCDGQLHKF